MSAAQRKSLHTGGNVEAGQRTDSMMILHVGSNRPTLISLPRDSNVTIPKFRGAESGKIRPAMGANKLNASYAFDGPQLLVRTVEYNTGLHIDHYAEIGFTGFANIVDAMGGVEMNLDKGFTDKWSGADFQARPADPQRHPGTRLRPHPARLHRQRPGPHQEPAEIPLDARKPGGHARRPPQPVHALPGHERGPGHPRRRQGHEPLPARQDVLRHEGRLRRCDGKSLNMPISGSVGGNLQWDRPKVTQLVNELKNDAPVTVTSDS